MNVPPPHVIVQIDEHGVVACDGYYDLPVRVPSYIALVTDGSAVADREASLLRSELRRQITALPGARFEKTSLPCGTCPAHRRDFHCQAIDRETSHNVLVFLSRGGTPKPHPRVIMPSRAPRVIALIAPGASPPSLPWSTPTTNTAHWVRHATEFMPEILTAAGLTDPEARVFISYRRAEATPLAEQLFDALGRRNFDVFVDRFRIAVGADFHQRILQELAHKSMVVYLESANILASKWTRYEIAVAKSARLGVLAIHMPGGQRIRAIDDSRRMPISLKNGKMTKAQLSDVVDRIATEHSASQMRRRRLLRENMQRALALAGVHDQSVENGMIVVQPKRQSSTHYLAALPSRPAELADFHRTATMVHPGTLVRTVIGPSAHLVGDERRRMQWLADVAGVRSFDEGAMLQVARAMQRESL